MVSKFAKKQYVRKQSRVDHMRASFDAATIAVVFDYRGLTVAELFELRKKLRAVGGSLDIAKNTLIKRAIEGTSAEVISPALKGPTAVLSAQGDQVQPVKAMKEWLKAAKKKDNVIRGAFLDGQLLSAAEVDALADLPSREVLLAKLVGAIAYPQQQLVGTLIAPHRQLANVLDQFGEKKKADNQ
ncbi:MAG: 50S ribosomal protein L10 [Vampirovibrionales bacterium]|nr:50S ribosomal protein L10 [Vampirovibrionales bacterium]